MTLIGYWPLNEASGDTAHDHSGNTYHANVNDGGDSDVLGSDGPLGQKAYSFDGNNDYTDIGEYVTMSSNGWTVTAWINVSGHKDYNNIVGAGDDPGNGYVRPGGYICTDAEGRMRDYDGEWLFGGTQLEENRWYFVTYQLFPDFTYKMFLDGVKDGEFSANPENYNGDLINRHIGRFGGSVERYFNGKISEVRIYNRALTPSEIQYLYSVGKRGLQTTSKKSS